ncbi:MAG: hypothetical protein V3T31_09675, partial [candidate division Zixibacteria bacterium]
MTDRSINTQSGFSLIEILVLIVVIGIIAGTALRSLTPVIDDVRRVQTEGEMEMLSEAITGSPERLQAGKRSDFGYFGDIGAFPSNLAALTVNPGGYTTWDGPYLPAGIAEDSLGFKADEWGIAYSYSGGNSIVSSGSGSTITKRVADQTADYLFNSLIGVVRDNQDSAPDSTDRDSIDITITVPDGIGGTRTENCSVDSAGQFILDSLPAGKHPLEIVYTPNVDTLRRWVTVLPRNRGMSSYRFASAYFTTYAPSPILFLSTNNSATLGGLSFDSEDIVRYRVDSTSATMVFDGSVDFTISSNIDAAHILGNGHIVLSTSGSAAVGGFSFGMIDLIDYDPVNLSASIFFDGASIMSAGANLDALHLPASGHILFSTDAAATVSGLSVGAEDIVDYDPVGNSVVVLFDGSALLSPAQNIDALNVQADGVIIFSTDGSSSIGPLSFEDEDLVAYDPSDGSASLYFDGDVPFGGSGSGIDALRVGSSNVSFMILRPSGAGFLSDIALEGCPSNYLCVNEPLNDGDATRLTRAASSYATDLYELDDPITSSGNIANVEVFCIARRAMSSGSVRPAIYIGGVQYSGAVRHLGATYATYGEQ